MGIFQGNSRPDKNVASTDVQISPFSTADLCQGQINKVSMGSVAAAVGLLLGVD